jgi:hypothetical protein
VAILLWGGQVWQVVIYLEVCTGVTAACICEDSEGCDRWSYLLPSERV